MRSFILATFAILIVANPAHADSPKWPFSMFDMENADTTTLTKKTLTQISTDQLKQMAEAGDPLAMTIYGNALEEGLGGLTRSPEAAFDWMRRSCAHGNARGCVGTALRLVNEDNHGAVQLLADACEKGGLPYACATLGLVYDKGTIGVTKDRAKANSYWKMVCAGGEEDGTDLSLLSFTVGLIPNGDACFYLGQSWEKGDGVAQADAVKAFRYYRTACEDGYPGDHTGEACYDVGYMIQSRKIRAKAGSSWDSFATMTKAYDTACTKYEDPTACFNLAVAYSKGKSGSEPDYQKAYSYYAKACKLGNADACYNQGTWLLRGDRVQADYNKAFEILDQLCSRDKNPDFPACNNAGMAAERCADANCGANDGVSRGYYYTSAQIDYERACFKGDVKQSCESLDASYKIHGGASQQDRDKLDRQLCYLNHGNFCDGDGF